MRGGRIGGEFYIHYAEHPTPHARLEEAYTNLPDPAVRSARVIRNLQRIVIGDAPKTPRRAKRVKVGPKVRKARHQVPWEIPGFGISIFGAAPKKVRKAQPLGLTVPLAVGSGIPDLFFGRKKRQRQRRRR